MIWVCTVCPGISVRGHEDCRGARGLSRGHEDCQGGTTIVEVTRGLLRRHEDC